jgi:ABC-type amino acid transport substrate-binding protein
MTMTRTILTAAAIALFTALAVVLLVPRASNLSAVSGQGTAYDRVMESGVIRCGYVPYPPGLIKDPNTGHISGVFADAITMAVQNLGLKVQWVEEVGWGSMIEGLNANRYDLICSPVWANSTRARVADFTVPLFYSGIDAYVRTDDNRLVGAVDKLNAPNLTISTIDGEMSAIIASHEFPKARTLSLPQTADDSQLLLNVSEGKADVTFVEPYIANQFLKSHPGSVKNITADHPIRVFPNTMMLKAGDERLKAMLNVALSELLNSGEIDALLTQYAGSGLPFYPVSKPYRAD